MSKAGLTLCALLLMAAIFSTVAGEVSHHRARALVEKGTILPLQQILNQIEGEQQGRVLEVKLEQEDSGYVYEIELLSPDGHVWELEFNANTGQLIEREKEE